MKTPNSEEIRQKLNKLPLTKAEIIRQTGLPQVWFYEYLRGLIKEPSYNRVRLLEDLIDSYE